MFSRRSFLKLTAASLPGLAVGCAGGFLPEEVPESLTRFPRTPIAGDMQATRVVLTFFVADDSPVTLRMWTEDGVVVDEDVAPSGDGFHKVMIDELVPGTKLIIPAGAVHAEGAVRARMVYVVATEPAENLMDVLLPLHDPGSPDRPGG